MKNAKTDCFAYAGLTCRVLNTYDCLGCKFYKTQEQFDEAHQRTVKRFEEGANISYDAFIDFWKKKKAGHK